MAPPKSKTWSYFKKIDGVIAKCKFCLQDVWYCGNTSNVAKHLKKHSNALESVKEESPTNALISKSAKQSKLSLTKYI